MRTARTAPRFGATSGVAALLAAALALPACKMVREKYYNALEKVGIEKRELLVSRVDKAREAQVEAQKQFKDALEEFQALVGYQGGDLEKMYGKLSSEYEASERKADEVRERIAKIEQVAQSLFEEWQREIGQYPTRSTGARASATWPRRGSAPTRSSRRSSARRRRWTRCCSSCATRCCSSSTTSTRARSARSPAPPRASSSRSPD